MNELARVRLGGMLSWDVLAFAAAFAIALLVSAFFKLDWWRAQLIGSSTVDWPVLAGFELVLVAAAWRFLLRRGFVWAEPAALTWLDFTHGGRERVVARRLLITWVALLATLGYVVALGAAVYAIPATAGWGLAAVLATSALLALAAARRARSEWWDTAWPVALAVAGAAALRLPDGWLYAMAIVLLLLGIVRWRGSGALSRAEAALAGRQSLVDTWNERIVRAVAVGMLDPTMMLPASRPVGGRSLRRPVLLRLAWLGVLGRARHAASAALVAVVIAMTGAALPALPDLALVAVGGYLALTPLGAGLGELWRRPGLRRWIGARTG